MKRIIFSILSFSVALLVSNSAYAAPTKVTTAFGMDISYPQCDTKVPTNHAFGIVGVNDGLATTPNPCLAKQLVWASKAVGGTKQDKVQLYVNTANPGGLGTPTWPQDNSDPAGNFVINQYGLCNGNDSYACAWQYGWNRAHNDVNTWFPPAAQQAKIDRDPRSYIWWLDVELENTWKTGKTEFDQTSNVAVLEGMVAYFSEMNIRTGIYSTSYQWSEITGGRIDDTSNLVGKPNWRPGGINLSTAKQACDATPLTKDGEVVLAQYISRGLDYNYSCI
jgi:hypothetical protein